MHKRGPSTENQNYGSDSCVNLGEDMFAVKQGIFAFHVNGARP